MKTKLEVIRLTNEDVIATSGKLYLTGWCVTIKDKNSSRNVDDNDELYWWEDDEYYQYPKDSPIDTYSSHAVDFQRSGTTPQIGSIYKEYIDESGYCYYYLCDQQHNHNYPD